jgi:hypothetical protein
MVQTAEMKHESAKKRKEIALNEFIKYFAKANNPPNLPI